MKNFRAGVLAARRFVNTGPTFTQWKSNTAAYSTASFLQGLKRPSAKDHLSALTDEGPASLERLSEPGTGAGSTARYGSLAVVATGTSTRPPRPRRASTTCISTLWWPGSESAAKTPVVERHMEQVRGRQGEVLVRR